MSNVVHAGDLESFFSRNPPVELRQILTQALNVKNSIDKESALIRAREEWPCEPDSHISLYKFYFITADYLKAEAAVWQALKIAAKNAGFTKNYRLLNKQSADWSQREGMERFYLFSLKALGVCRLRRGKVLAAFTVLKKLLELDASDEIGGGAYLGIASSFFSDE